MKMQKVVKTNGEIWVQTINDDGVIVHEGLLHTDGAEPIQPDFELPPVEEKRKLSKKRKFAIAAIAGGALFTAAIVVRRYKRRRERA